MWFTYFLEYIFFQACQFVRTRLAPSLSFLSPSRHQYKKSTYQGVSYSPLCSVLSVPPTLDDLLLFAPCRLISSSSHVRDLLFRGFPCRSANSTFYLKSCAFLTLDKFLYNSCLLRRFPFPCLQGFDPNDNPFSLSMRLTLTRFRSPPKLPLLWVLAPNCLDHTLAYDPPLVSFSGHSSLWNDHWDFSVFSTRTARLSPV
jgi:hypothetical protein